jgi:hypothetical protein
MKGDKREPNTPFSPVDIGDEVEVKIQNVKPNGLVATKMDDNDYYPIYIKPIEGRKFAVGETVKVFIIKLLDGCAEAVLAP